VSSRPLLIVLLLLAACGHGNRPGSRSELPQVVYLGVDGAKDPNVDERVEELIRKRFDIIDRDTYMEKARELGADKITRKNLAKVTSSLGALALVHGSARGKKKQSVTIFVREPKKGKIVERYKLSVRKGKLAKKSDRALEKRLLASVKIPKKKEPPPAPEAEEEEEAEAVAEKEPKKEEKGEKASEDEEDADPDPPPKIEVDESGQAIDDEMPPM
jgi:hypothetical protein